MQPLRLGARDQRIMRNRKQVLRHEPDGLLRGHPLEGIETAHADGPGKSSHRSLPPLIEIHAEITDRHCAQRTIHRFAIATIVVTRVSDRTPASVDSICCY